MRFIKHSESRRGRTLDVAWSDPKGSSHQRILWVVFGFPLLKMKLWYYGSASCWIIYAISIASPAAFMYDVVGIVVLTYSIYKIIKSTKNII
ncbi:MAG: YgjV family protein [Alphaproteobacteria bacterium]